MKTDAEYLTEHVLGRYFCPCSDDSRRRVKKKHVKESARHAHEHLFEIVACMAAYLELRLKMKFYYFPQKKLATALSVNKALPPVNDIRAFLLSLIDRDELIHCQSKNELIKHADLVTDELLAQEEAYKKSALSKAQETSLSIPEFVRTGQKVRA